ncbi:class IV adenylate cyclase [soil metagenome]
MRNLELKVRCSNGVTLDALARRALAGGAVHVQTMWQRDTYFVVPRGRLKLREWRREEDGGDVSEAGSYERGEAGAALISYVRPDHSGSRFSDYRIVSIDDPEALIPLLAGALGAKAVVEKRRAFYRYGDTRIHLDLVAELGAFVELETVLPGGEQAAARRAASESATIAEHRAVITLLELDGLPAVAGSYCDLLAEKEGPER